VEKLEQPPDPERIKAGPPKPTEPPVKAKPKGSKSKQLSQAASNFAVDARAASMAIITPDTINFGNMNGAEVIRKNRQFVERLDKSIRNMRKLYKKIIIELQREKLV
jgi:hypothetical protein